EIELALFRLAEATGERKYADLALHFLDLRGNNEKECANPLYDFEYDQSHKPLKEQTSAIGHSVRAGYIYSAMADAASYYDDAEYFSACEKLFCDVTEKKMYITGGIGSSGSREAFSGEYDLPNKTSYAETCAAISLAYFARRMMKLDPDSKYADAVERVMYNGALSGVSLDGTKFFYSNALEVDTKAYMPGATTKFLTQERVGVFYCSCCPPNILRFIASISDSFYTYNNDTLFVHQYAQSSAEVNGARVTQKTDYPVSGEVKLSVSGVFGTVAVRIPGWCRSFTLDAPYKLKGGYAYVEVPDDGEITIDFDMTPTLVGSHPAVRCNIGKAAVARGPVVYCLEGKDNEYDLQKLCLNAGCEFDISFSEEFALPVLTTTGFCKRGAPSLYAPYIAEYDPATLKFIPYFAFANRGGDDMIVWIKIKD
ncbi:MAG: glycoside hydrolase family 127 protein, partial [Clostridia bacterium]|nr:glycoside hydrolase family 127 protein [Clostridia bacterium]